MDTMTVTDSNATALLWSDAIQMGNYAVLTENEQFFIFPRGRNGESMRVAIIRKFIRLRHTSGDEFYFKKYLHQKKWYWSDSRVTGHVGRDKVLTEIARLLFKGNMAGATAFVNEHLGN